MSSTNHTTNYNLPQYVGSDKPAWLGDINPAFSTIDTQMKANNTLAQQGVTDAGTADGKAVQAQADATQALTNASTAQNTANTASAEATRVGQVLDAYISSMKLTDFTSCEIIATGANLNSAIRLTLAQSEDGSAFKLYGYYNIVNNTSTAKGNPFTFVNVTVGTGTFTGVDTGLVLNTTPESAFVISPIGIMLTRDDSSSSLVIRNTTAVNMCVGTNGHIYVSANSSLPAKTTYMYHVEPCLYFNTNFGDTPESE